MSDEYILDDVVETFSDEDTLMSDIRNNPVKWLLSLAVVGPGMAYTMSEHASYEAALEGWGLPTGLEWILAVFVTGQLLIAPLSCYFLARTGNVASGLFIAMGGSAILVANPDEIAQFSEAFGWPFFALNVGVFGLCPWTPPKFSNFLASPFRSLPHQPTLHLWPGPLG